MLQSILFSITIPAYKSKYLKEAIDSCLSQSYANFELIIVDDASPENLHEIVSLYNDNRIRYYRNEKNCGALHVVDNWNICLNYCNGEYVICMGDDDRLKPCCLEQYAKLIDKYPEKKIFHALTELIDENGNVIKQLPRHPETESVLSMIWNHWCGNAQYIGDFCFHLRQLRQNGGFFKQPLAWGADDISTARAASYAGIANTQIACFQYRENRQTISRSGNSKIKLEAKLLEKKWFAAFLKAYNNLKNEEEKILCRKIQAEFDKHYLGQMLQYMKEYMQESLWNIVPLLYTTKHYCVKRRKVLQLFLKVVNYQLKYKKHE